MGAALHHVLACIRYSHDQRLILVAAIVCATGVYASFALAGHASRGDRRQRRIWAPLSIVAAGCTAWATHFIVLLAFKPGMPAAFDPLLTAISLLSAIAGIGAGMMLGLRERRAKRRFTAGMVMGLGIVALHYVGQAAYRVQGTVSWNLSLVLPSIALSLPLCGSAMLAAAHRKPSRRQLAAPLLLGAIAVLHFCGMAAMKLHFDPHMRFHRYSVAPATITPVVVSISLGLLALAITGLRFEIATRARQRWERRRLGELAGVALEGLLICNGDTVLTANSSMERLAGCKPGSLAGASVRSLLPHLDLSDMPEREEREAELVTVAGDPVPVRVLRSEVRIARKRQTVIAVRDQRERLRTEEKMRTLAFSDALTGLPNRTRFFDMLAKHAASRRGGDAQFSVLMIDLDRFKLINDTLGHAAGDDLLRGVAQRLGSLVREQDLIARLGGDEFAILQLDAPTPKTAEQLAERILESLASQPFPLEGQLTFVGGSVGIAYAPEDGDDPAELLRQADLALYAAKAEGRGKYRRYDSSLLARSQGRRALEHGLRRALSNGHLDLHYQPVVDARSGRVISAEALVRWHHPERGPISPVEFISVAEETGLILPLGEWVLRTACAEAATWPDNIRVAVNLSPMQFREQSLVAMIDSGLESAGLRADRLELEITEGVLLADEEQTFEMLTRLKKRGLKISMDDFGTGYSSLSYLRRFPFDKVKIDRSFIHQVPDNVESAAIVRAIVTLCKTLGMTVTVEGVESQRQYDFSTAEGCDAIQGYHISRPLTAKKFARFVEARQGSRAVPAYA